MGFMSVSSCRWCIFCVLRASCRSSQCFILHDLQFVMLVEDAKVTIRKGHTPEPVSLLTYR